VTLDWTDDRGRRHADDALLGFEGDLDLITAFADDEYRRAVVATSRLVTVRRQVNDRPHRTRRRPAHTQGGPGVMGLAGLVR
jgi:hypothetical protein